MHCCAARFLTGLAGLLGVVMPVAGYGQPAPITRSSVPATPVEIAADVVNGVLQCRPPRLRLPARDLLELRVVNRAERATMFVAPEFFKSTAHLDSSGFAYDVTQGGFLVAPKSTVRVTLMTPTPGEYYYSCYLPGTTPTPQGSGFLTVVPSAQ